MKQAIYFLTILTLFLTCGCSENKDENSTNSEFEEEEFEQEENNLILDQASEEIKIEENDDYRDEGQIFENGTYPAFVDYYNPQTGYSASYYLDVEVEYNQITIIYFPNDGYLDDDHIWPEELDENGYAFIYGEDDKSYEVQIDY